MEETRYSIKNVAHIFGVTIRTILRWEKDNKIPRLKRYAINNRPFATKQDIEELKAIIRKCRPIP